MSVVEVDPDLLASYREVVDRISYRDDYWFRVDMDIEGHYYVQLEHVREDADTGGWGTGYSRRAVLTSDMTDSAIVRLCLSLALGYEEHEVREFFRYRGARVFGPHLDVEALVEIADRLER